MEPAAIIITYIIWTDWKSLPFNLSLFVFQLLFLVAGKILGKVEVEWSEIWHAAQVSHVRLCLGETPVSKQEYRVSYEYINFGYPVAELQQWRPNQCDGKRFEYREPTFETPPQFVAAMIEYARDQVGKGYDDLQLISSGLHLIAWIVYPPCWGKELKIIKAFNRKGGREFCSSGVTACLRWADEAAVARANSLWIKFYHDYDTAMVWPCMFVISKNWRLK